MEWVRADDSACAHMIDELVLITRATDCVVACVLPMGSAGSVNTCASNPGLGMPGQPVAAKLRRERCNVEVDVSVSDLVICFNICAVS